jgi:phosphatidylserine/phosphatidylglycerophosphate/cardiolipin synthase-like enzyme
MRKALLLVLLASCAPPDPNRLFVSVNAEIELGEDEAADHFRGVIDAAEESLFVALPGGENVDLADAIVDAWDRNVEVEVLTDFDLATSPAITRLLEADVPVALRDAGLTYFDFGQNADLGFPSPMTIMSNAYVVQDETRLVAADRIGTNDDGARVVFEIRGEDVIEDLLREHRQIYGGTDATAVDAYSAPNKSILETRWRYGTTTDVELEVWFGPQERLLKRVIDAVYSARSSVWVLTDDFSSQGLADALQDKAKWGYDVQVVVGPHFGDANNLLSRFLTDADEVPTRQVLDVGDVPTLVLVDYEDDAEGYRPRTRAMVLTHDLFSASRLYRGDPVLTDQLIDGTMYVLTDIDEPSPELLELEALFRDHYDRSEAL